MAFHLCMDIIKAIHENGVSLLGEVENNPTF